MDDNDKTKPMGQVIQTDEPRIKGRLGEMCQRLRKVALIVKCDRRGLHSA